jgi:hypothetical protein
LLLLILANLPRRCAAFTSAWKRSSLACDKALTALTMVFFLILVADGGDASPPSATRNLALFVRAEVVARI